MSYRTTLHLICIALLACTPACKRESNSLDAALQKHLADEVSTYEGQGRPKHPFTTFYIEEYDKAKADLIITSTASHLGNFRHYRKPLTELTLAVSAKESFQLTVNFNPAESKPSDSYEFNITHQVSGQEKSFTLPVEYLGRELTAWQNDKVRIGIRPSNAE